MKAIFFEQHGGPEVLRFADLPDPEPKPGEALIRVRAVALNHLDIWVRYGWKGLQLAMPHILGSDVAGEVVKVADDQSRWKLGDRVILNPGIVSGEDEWTRRGQHSLMVLTATGTTGGKLPCSTKVKFCSEIQMSGLGM